MVDGNFVANFEKNDMPAVATFRINGKWLHTIFDMKKDQIPDCMKESLKQFDEYKILSALQVDSPKKSHYELNIVSSDERDYDWDSTDQMETGNNLSYYHIKLNSECETTSLLKLL